MSHGKGNAGHGKPDGGKPDDGKNVQGNPVESEKPRASDPGNAPGRYDPNQATGGDPPLAASDVKNAGVAPVVGGGMQSGPSVKAERIGGASYAPASKSLPAAMGGTTVSDVIATVRAFMASVRARDVSGAAKSLSTLLSMFGEVFGTPPQTVRDAAESTASRTEFNNLEAEFAAFKGEQTGTLTDFKNPTYATQGGRAAGVAPGMATTGATAAAGIDPSTIMMFLELAQKLFEWFRNRNN